MRLTIVAVGRMKKGPEVELATRYLQRLGKSGVALGLDFAGVVELVESRAQGLEERRSDEAARILAALPEKALLAVLDERGRELSSTDFSQEIARLRDEGARDMAFVIGGPDGLASTLRERAQLVLSFGRMTFPHQIVRILLAEQLYRAATILSGHPYHRA